MSNFSFIFIVIFFINYIYASSNSISQGHTILLPSKRTHISQLDTILLSIDQRLQELLEKQKQENLPSKAVNDLQIVNHRLQNIEEQIARSETFNKLRSDEFLKYAIKNELLIDQLNLRIDKNHQQISNRLLHIEIALEKITQNQEVLEKDIRKTKIIQDDLITKVQDTSENVHYVKTKTIESFQNMNISQITFQQQVQNMIENMSNHEDITNSVKKLGQQINTTTNDVIKCSQNDDTYINTIPKPQLLSDIIRSESSKLINTVESMYHNLEKQTESIGAISKQSVEIGNKIREDMNHKHQSMRELILNFPSDSSELNETNVIRCSDAEIKDNVETILKEQRNFTQNCYNQLQVNQNHVENQAVAVLYGLLDLINKRSDSVRQDFLTLNESVHLRESRISIQIEELSGLVKSEIDRISSTVALNTNHVLEIGKAYKLVNNSLTHVENICHIIFDNIQEIRAVMKIPTNDDRFMDENMKSEEYAIDPNYITLLEKTKMNNCVNCKNPLQDETDMNIFKQYFKSFENANKKTKMNDESKINDNQKKETSEGIQKYTNELLKKDEKNFNYQN